MGTENPTWSEQWGTNGSYGNNDHALSKPKNNKMEGFKTAASAGLGKAAVVSKKAAKVGFVKAKAAAVVGAKKVKIGSVLGFKWVKAQYNKKRKSS